MTDVDRAKRLELTTEVRDQVLSLRDTARAHDGVSPLNEDALLVINAGSQGPEHVHLCVLRQTALVGYAQLDIGAEAPTAQLVIDPAHRRQGLGTDLLDALAAIAHDDLRAWAFGNLPAAQALARQHQLVPVRQLLIMQHELGEARSSRPAPEGIKIRPFRPGRDDQAWLALNARTFADHPDQGQLDNQGLRARLAEPWFDPAGFLLADRGGELVGFHWTKREDADTGEVYVLGVDPAAAGLGLGGALLDAGLARLSSIGVHRVLLYVEADNNRAVGMYASAGFAVINRDVMYAHQGRGGHEHR